MRSYVMAVALAAFFGMPAFAFGDLLQLQQARQRQALAQQHDMEKLEADTKIEQFKLEIPGLLKKFRTNLEEKKTPKAEIDVAEAKEKIRLEGEIKKFDLGLRQKHQAEESALVLQQKYQRYMAQAQYQAQRQLAYQQWQAQRQQALLIQRAFEQQRRIIQEVNKAAQKAAKQRSKSRKR